MYKMHENQQGKRANLSMSAESMKSSISKSTQKKAPFYQHDDPTNLNYYARFSPNRKKVDEEFEFCIIEGSSPLSPRSSKSSSLTKRSNFSLKKMPRNQKQQDVESQKIELIDESLLLAINQKHIDRNEIYIDQEDKSSQDNEQTDKASISRSLFRNTPGQFPKNWLISKINPHFQLNQPIPQSFKQPSQHQQSSSSQRINEPSSSKDNQIINFPRAPTCLEMRIEDDDSDHDQSHNPPHNHPSQNQDQIMIQDSSEQQFFQVAKNIGSVIIQKRDTSFTRQVKSENVSFSIDSDLSMIQEKWNSYFEADNDPSEQNENQRKGNIFSENISQIGHKNQVQIYEQINQRKLSDSSDDELPSFSNPNSQNHVTFEQSRPESVHQYFHSQERQMNEEDKKQFKRQYTFGNELNAAFSNNDETNQSKIESKKSLPLFMKFLSKETISGFSKNKAKNGKKQSNQTKKQVIKVDKIQKPRTVIKPQRTNSIKNTPKHNKQTKVQYEAPIKNLQKLPITQQEHNQVAQKVFISNEILIQEDQNESDSENFQKTQSLAPEIQIKQIQNQITFRYNENNPIQVNFQSENKVQKINKKSFSSNKFHQNPIQKSNWKQTIITMLKQQMKQQNSITQKASLNQDYQNHLQQKEQKSFDDQQQHSEIHLQEEQISDQKAKQQISHKTTKNQEVTGYAKIYSRKAGYKGKVKTEFYHDILKPSPSHYQGSENDDISSQNYDQSYPKGSQIQSLTTATEQLSYNFHAQTYQSPKNRSNGIEEVENLKKYLKKMEESSKVEQKQQSLQGRFQINQSLEQLETSRSQLPENDPFERFKSPDSVSSQKSSIVQESSKQQPLITERSSIPQRKIPQTHQIKIDQQPKQPQTFGKSLKMLEDLIPTLPQELIPTYDKIYTHVFEQQLKYQKRIEKQSFLLNFMEQFMKGQKEKIDCEGFLSSESIDLQSTKEMKFSTDDQELQIFINKHIILALIRKLAVD